MDAREEIGKLILEAPAPVGHTRTSVLVEALVRYMPVLDAEILKLRKELRTRNVSSSEYAPPGGPNARNPESRGRQVEREEREELETAWLRGFKGAKMGIEPGKEARQIAADYAERVIGGSTGSGEPQVPRSLGEQSSPQKPERPEI